MSGLPTGWAETTLGAVIDYGKTEKVEPDAIADDAWILELEDIEKDTSKIVSRARFAERKSKSTKNRFLRGDVLYGKLRPYLNKVVVADADGYCTTEIIPIAPTEATENRYVFHWLKHPRFLDYVTEVSHGLNMPRLGTEAGRSAPFVLAPLPEQTRIADKLDALLSRVDAARERLARVPALLKRFRQSVLAAATSGELTEDVDFAELERVRLGDIAKWSSGGTPSRSNKNYFGGDILWVKTGELREAIILDTEEKLTALGVENSSAKVFPRDTVIVAMYGATIGRVAKLGVSAATNQACAAAMPIPEKMLPEYLFYLLQSEKQRLAEKGQGGAQPNISQAVIKAHEILLPCLEEQAEIIRRVEALFALADQVQARYDAARARVDKLTPALLAKAFRGELVPQDPNDEPASVLLERLRTSKASEATPAKRGRKPSTDAAKTRTAR